MDSAYAQNYRELYERHFWWRARERIVMDELRRLCRQPGHERFLDVGCGDGLFFDCLSELGEVEGVEPFAPLSSAAGQRKIWTCPFDQRFAPRKRFSALLMLDVLEHLPDPQAALGHARSLLEPGGFILITVPAYPLLWTHHDEINHHHLRYTKRSLQLVAAAAGLQVQRSEYLFRWMFPLKLGVRIVESVTARHAAAETIPPAWLNRVLYECSLWDRRLLPSRMPFGTSLMAVCVPG